MKQFTKIISLSFIFASLSWGSWFSSMTSPMEKALAVILRYIPLGTSNYRSPTIAQSEFNPAQASGKVVNNVNLFNGQPYYQVPLAQLNTPNGLSWNLTMSYYGGIQPIIRSTNDVAPVGIVGLGWNLETPYVAVSHNGTVSTTDDMLYCNLGPYGSGQIMQNGQGVYYLSTNPQISIIPSIKKGKFTSWTFVMPDGNKMFFGENDNSKRFQLYQGNVITAFPKTASSTRKFAYRFDLSRVSDFSEKNNILFEYSKTQEAVSSTASYDRESVLSSIYWKNKGVTVDSIALLYTQKTSVEYDGYVENESRENQRLYATKDLDKVQVFAMNNKVKEIKFHYVISPLKMGIYKNLLMSMDVSIVNGETRSRSFSYDPLTNLLSSVGTSNGSVEHFQSAFLNIQKESTMSPRNPEKMTDADGAEIEIDENAVDEKKYRNNVSCTEEFCYAYLIDGREEKKNNFYLQAYQNSGNYFTNVGSYSVKQRNNPLFSKGSDFFIIADKGGRYIDFYEWDGSSFVKKNSDIGDFFVDSTLLTGKIENIFVAENYVLIEENDDDDEYRIYAVVKDASTGIWKLLSKNKSDCGFANTSDYGEDIRSSKSEACLEWDNEITVGVTKNFFIVGDNDDDVLNVFAFDGGSFRELSFDRNLFPDLGIQLNSGKSDVYSTNFQKSLDDIVISNNTVILTFNRKGDEYTVILAFDGNKFHELANEKWDDGEHDRGTVFYPFENYILEVSYAKSNVFVWRKSQEGDIVKFKRYNTGIFSFNAGDGNSVFVSGTKDAFYLEERYSGGRTVIKDGRYHHYLIEVPKNPQSSMLDYTSQLDNDAFELYFSNSDPVVVFQKGVNANGQLCALGETCYPKIYSRLRQYSYGNFFSSNAYREVGLDWFAYLSDGRNNQLSIPNRLMMRSVVDKTSKRVLLDLAQFAGENYDVPSNYPVVYKYWKETGLESLGKTGEYAVFDYGLGANTLYTVEFNSNTLSAEFLAPSVTYYTSDNKVITSESHYFRLDTDLQPLMGFNKNLKGVEMRVSYKDALGANVKNEEYQYSVDEGIGLDWPNGLVVNRLNSTYSYVYDQFGSFSSALKYNRMLDGKSGAFCGTVDKAGGKTVFNQFILSTHRYGDGSGIEYEFSLPVVSSRTVFLEDADAPLNAFDGACTDELLYADSIAEIKKFEYSNVEPGLKTASYRWQPSTRLGKGFNPYDGYVLTDTLVSYNEFVQPTEMKRLTKAGLKSDCYVYEGHRSLQTATFKGASCSDVASTTAEHGNLNGWEMAQTTLDSSIVYDGLYSFKVVDGYGPTRNISLKEVKRYKYDYVISAFAYSTKDRPMLIAEFRKADKSILKIIASYAPVGESFKAKKWQRYELTIPYDTLVASGMFENVDDDDHLRIWLGFGEPKNDAAKIVYVDDFVAYPSSAVFNLQSYDRLGLKISSLNKRYLKYEYVYDMNHEYRTMRDEKGRLMKDLAKHELNENVGE